MASSAASCAAVLAAVAIFRKQDWKATRVRDLQFLTDHRKTLSDLLHPLVEPERRHVFQAAELLSALEQAAYSFNQGLVRRWARDSFHDEFVGLVKPALADDTPLRFVRQDDGHRPYREILAFMHADRRMFGGELRAIPSQRTAPPLPVDPKFRLNTWRVRREDVVRKRGRRNAKRPAGPGRDG